VKEVEDEWVAEDYFNLFYNSARRGREKRLKRVRVTEIESRN
jgi:hypothetical protein